jgi:predicted secreted protein
MTTYTITQESKDKELLTISTILTSNHYNQQVMQQKGKQTPNMKETQQLKWA